MDSLEQVEVVARPVANEQAAVVHPAIVTALRFDPQVDVQTRGLAEGQADVAVRGGLFENTGFRLGATPIFDPQTGHYSVEVPVDPEMLSAPTILTDSDNAISSFNATLATIKYDFAEIRDGGSARLGVGTDGLYAASARSSRKVELEGGGSLASTLAATLSRGDGTLPLGDHDFKRISGHVQVDHFGGESNVLLGYSDKFYGWPGAYTGFASLPETDHVKQGLVLFDHRQSSDRGWWEAGFAYRWLDDDYDFDRRTRESGQAGSFEHETRNFSLGVNGVHRHGRTHWTYSAVLAADRLVRSTDLVYGHFDSRTYLALAVAPERHWFLSSGNSLSIRAGLRADISNRDEDTLLPMVSVRWEQPLPEGTRSFAIDVSRTSQLPGYTALNSRAAGLFGGNPDLEREYADTVTLRYEQQRGAWQTRLAVFSRQDRDLVDWTYRQGAPFIRQANPVDMDVIGAEAWVAWSNEAWNIFGAYTFIDKDEDYGSTLVDASYYALNFARHRATFALYYKPGERVDIRLDNEYRVQQENALRSGDNEAWLVSLSVGWRPALAHGLRFDLIADNLTDSEFQEFPGTPAYGRQLSLVLSLDW